MVSDFISLFGGKGAFFYTFRQDPLSHCKRFCLVEVAPTEWFAPARNTTVYPNNRIQNYPNGMFSRIPGPCRQYVHERGVKQYSVLEVSIRLEVSTQLEVSVRISDYPAGDFLPE